jgi:3-phenylpropionate/cinnamic acid dioxygenase small subunit
MSSIMPIRGGGIMRHLKFFVLAILVLTALVGSFAKDSAIAGEDITIEDRLSILDLIALYGRTYDDHDAAGWAALFTDSAPMPMYLAGKLSRELNTNEERRKWAQSRFETFDKDGVFKIRHYQTNTLLTQRDDGTVEGTTLFFVTLQYAAETTPRPIHTGMYRDHFVKTPEGWRFAKREIHIDHK